MFPGPFGLAIHGILWGSLLQFNRVPICPSATSEKVMMLRAHHFRYCKLFLCANTMKEFSSKAIIEYYKFMAFLECSYQTNIHILGIRRCGWFAWNWGLYINLRHRFSKGVACCRRFLYRALHLSSYFCAIFLNESEQMQGLNFDYWKCIENYHIIAPGWHCTNPCADAKGSLYFNYYILFHGNSVPSVDGHGEKKAE